jgi:hypothetical protein
MEKFTVYVQRVYFVDSCAEKLAEESRGLMGFHNFKRCPNCNVRFDGWEFWGENGHRQSYAKDGASMLRVARRLRQKGCRMVKGCGIYYVGQPSGK